MRAISSPAPSLIEQQLHETQLHFRTVLNSAAIVLFALDREGRFTLLEGKGLEVVGLAPGQLVGRSVFEVYRDIPDVRERFARALAGELSISTDEVSGRTFESQLMPLRDEAGKVAGVIGVATDITERRKLERALREHEELYRRLVESMNEGVLQVNNDDVIQFVNDRFCAMLGYARDELLGKVAMDLMLEEDDRPLMRARNRMRLKGISEQYEIRVRKKSGELMWVHVGAAPITNAAGTVVGSMAVLTDVSGRKRVEEYIQESERRLRQLAEHIKSVIWLVDQKVPAVLFVSRAYEEIWGRPAKSLYENPRAFIDAVPPEDRQGVLAALDRLLEGVPVDTNYRVVRPDGSMRWVRHRESPIKDRFGEVYRTAGFVEDVTDTKRLEESLLMRERKNALDEAGRAGGRFVARIAHEIRTPLTSIIGFANAMLRNEQQNLAAKDLEYLNRIVNNGKHLLQIVDQMLDPAWVESGKPAVILSDVALGELIAETVAGLEGQIPRDAVRVIQEVPGGLATLRTDYGKLKQILINLIGNALKFTKEGSIVVRVVANEPTHEPERIDVVDTGVGIAPDRLEMILRGQKEAGGSGEAGSHGAGLGLEISKSLCDLLGYRLGGESDVGKGSRFSVYLGAKRRPPESAK